MSGGSYDYAYSRVRDMAVEVRARHPMCPKRLAFAAHLSKVAAVELAEKAREALDGAIERAYPKEQRPPPPQVPMKVGRMREP